MHKYRPKNILLFLTSLIFFVVLLIILFAPIIMGKLRIPHIIRLVPEKKRVSSSGNRSNADLWETVPLRAVTTTKRWFLLMWEAS